MKTLLPKVYSVYPVVDMWTLGIIQQLTKSIISESDTNTAYFTNSPDGRIFVLRATLPARAFNHSVWDGGVWDWDSKGLQVFRFTNPRLTNQLGNNPINWKSCFTSFEIDVKGTTDET